MRRGTLNLGIVAHVDAGKTTLTERLLHAAGVIDTIGSVDAGTTQTDSMALERQRGITIKSAVVSFTIDDVGINLIDTPGHPDFIAEVERVLDVLDGAVLVVSAVEGVQPQTRVLFRALQRLGVPTLIFVNKIDRRGADVDRVLAAITARLTRGVVRMGVVHTPGTPDASFTRTDEATPLADVLTVHDDELLASYVEGTVTGARLRQALARQTRQAMVYPVFAGSAVTGAGLPELMAGLVTLLPTARGDANGPVSGRVFTIEREPGGQKVALVRMFSGTLQPRSIVRFGQCGEARVTAVNVFDTGRWVRRGQVRAGEIAKLYGLAAVQVGDPIGLVPMPAAAHHFAAPTLEAVVSACQPEQTAALRMALARLAEQDPLINVRQDDARREISVSLYGEVQKEVIQVTLANDFGIEVTFRETTMICIERPAGVGDAIEILNTQGNPFHATMGLHVAPGPRESGVTFRLAVDPRSVPLAVFKSIPGFLTAMEENVRLALREGLRGWQVTDCVVTLSACDYSLADGPPSHRGPMPTAGDLRKLTPLVIMQAVQQAGTVVCEPTLRVTVEIPADTVGMVMTVLAHLGATVVDAGTAHGGFASVQALLAAARVQDLRRQLPALTHGEGEVEAVFAGYEPVRGQPPQRRRILANPLQRDEYLTSLTRQGART